MWHMCTHISATRSILHSPVLSNTIGNVVTQTSSQNKCGGDSVERGLVVLRNFWKKGSGNNGTTPSTLLIGNTSTSTRGSKLTEHFRLVFRWLAIPWLQKEADAYVYDHNTSRRRSSHRKILPNGAPDVMFENPESFDARDFKVKCSDQKFYILILSCRSLFRMRCLRMPNVSGHHPRTPFSVLFLRAVRNTFLQFTCNLGAQKLVSIRSGTFIIRCAMLWTRNFCSSPALGMSMKRPDPKIPTQINHLFNIFGHVSSARMEILLCNMKVKQIVWLFF